MSLFVLYSAFILGFAGSFHCIGMCGPIAIGIASRATGNPVSRSGQHLLYFFGKTVTYMALGLVFGLFGQGLVLGGFQQALSVIMGIVMVMLAVVYLSKTSVFHKNYLTEVIQRKLVPVFSRILSGSGSFAPIYLGLLNGLLPCGLVYIGLAAAVATGNSLYSAAYMGIFGIATIPVMLAFMMFSGQITLSFKNQLQKIAPILIGIMGVFLVVRGLNLGIPYLSPVIDSLLLPADKSMEAVGCHP